MAKTEVQITAVDKTQAAVRSATNSLKTIEKTAKVTGKAINLAFGVLTGGALISAFGKLTEAAKKTDEGRKALDELSKTLRDPALVAAANGLSNALIGGFTMALQKVSAFIQYTRGELVKLGALEASGLAGQRALLEQEIERASRMATGTVPGAGMDLSPREQAAMIDAARVVNQEQQNRVALLRQALAIVNKQIDAERTLAMVAPPEKAKPSRAAKAGRTEKPEDYIGASISALQKKFNAWAEDLPEKMLDQIADAGKKMGEGLGDAIANGIDQRLLPAVGVLADFAADAAQGMQSAFSDFLFDPFENGLKGMAQGFLNMIRRMLADLLARQLLISFFGMFAGGSGFLGQFASSALGSLQARAMGGPVTGSTPYLVGERGPELFVPSTSGRIIPNGAGGGMSVSPVYNIDARGATMELTQALPSILADNNRKIFDELDRRYGIRR